MSVLTLVGNITRGIIASVLTLVGNIMGGLICECSYLSR